MLSIIGVNADSKTLCTPVAEKPGGFHPVWEEKLTFVVNVPQLAFLRFEVRDAVESSVGPDGVIGSRKFNDDPLIAQYTIKLSNVRNGFCAVALSRPTGEQLEHSRLFVKINLQPSQK